jgi:hemerythrin-like domain-containing protein
MLTATYALLTLSVEQKKERNFISRLLQHVRAMSNKPHAIDAAFIASQVDELTQLAESLHQRKVEHCLMPALRHASADAEPLLADLQSLTSLGGAMLCSVRKRLRVAAPRGIRQVKFLCRALDQYCHNLLARLEMEERQLLPLAQRVVSSEAWFKIGTMFLDHDAKRKEERRNASSWQGLVARRA